MNLKYSHYSIADVKAVKRLSAAAVAVTPAMESNILQTFAAAEEALARLEYGQALDLYEQVGNLILTYFGHKPPLTVPGQPTPHVYGLFDPMLKTACVSMANIARQLPKPGGEQPGDLSPAERRGLRAIPPTSSSSAKKIVAYSYGWLSGGQVQEIAWKPGGRPSLIGLKGVYEARLVTDRLSDLVFAPQCDADFVLGIPHLYYYVLPMRKAECCLGLGLHAAAEQHYLTAADYPYLNPEIEAPNLWLRLARLYRDWGPEYWIRIVTAAGTEPEGSPLYTRPALTSGTEKARHVLQHLSELISGKATIAQLGLDLDFVTVILEVYTWLLVLDWTGDPGVPMWTFEHLQNVARYMAQQAIQAEQMAFTFYDHADADLLQANDLKRAVDAAKSQVPESVADAEAASHYLDSLLGPCLASGNLLLSAGPLIVQCLPASIPLNSYLFAVAEEVIAQGKFTQEMAPTCVGAGDFMKVWYSWIDLQTGQPKEDWQLVRISGVVDPDTVTVNDWNPVPGRNYLRWEIHRPSAKQAWVDAVHELYLWYWAVVANPEWNQLTVLVGLPGSAEPVAVGGPPASLLSQEEQAKARVETAWLNMAAAESQIWSAEKRARATQAGVAAANAQAERAQGAYDDFAGADHVYNADVWRSLAGEAAAIARSYLRKALNVARQMERAWNFEYDDQSQFFGTDYIISFTPEKPVEGGVVEPLLVGERLLLNIDHFTVAQLQVARKQVPIKHTISLAQSFPFQFEFGLRRTGRMQFDTSLDLFDSAYPGTYRQRLEGVEVEFVGLLPRGGVRASLTHGGLCFYRTADDQVAFRLQPRETLVLSEFRASQDSLLLPADPRQMKVFQGAGVSGSWVLEVPAELNELDFRTLVDVRMTFYYRAFYSESLARMVRTRLEGKDSHQRSTSVSLRWLFPEAFFQFLDSGETQFELTDQDFAANQLDPQLARVSLLVSTRPGAVLGNLEFGLAVPGHPDAIFARPNAQGIITPADAPAWQDLGKGPALGAYRLCVGQPHGPLADAIADLVLILDYRFTPRLLGA